jgi:glycosyltransferase involved in cell wall biosynthesis
MSMVDRTERVRKKMAAPALALPPLATGSAGMGSTGVASVSVVVPCFRCGDTIAEAVASVAAQILRPAEVLLVDDGSGDGTLECLQRLARHYPEGWIKVLSMPCNGGPSGARNLGWEHATQTWIAFLDADDTWHPHKLKLQMEVVARDPQIAVVFHPMNVQAREAPAPALTYPLKVTLAKRHLLRIRTSFPTASVVLRRHLPFRFDENRKRAEDFLLWAQILLSGYRCACLNQVLASWHKEPFGAGGLSGDLAAMYAAALDARRALHAQGLLGWWQLQVLNCISLVRHARRHILTFARRRAHGMPRQTNSLKSQ